jgi:hypothetical protein
MHTQAEAVMMIPPLDDRLRYNPSVERKGSIQETGQSKDYG